MSMATISNVFCGICEVRHMSYAATFWCAECDEGLCMACHDHHSISKSSKQHKAIPIESYKKLPLTITKIVTYCHEHDMKYTNYCQHHEKLCCPACIHVDHKSCTDIQLLQHVLKTAKTSALLDSIEQSVKDIKSNITDIIENRERNITTINNQREIYQHEIKQVRKKVNAHIDSLERKILTHLDASKNKANTELERLIVQLSEKTRVADNFEQNISAIKLYASDLQAFIGSKSIETEVEEEEKYLQSLNKDGSLDQTRLKLNIDTKLAAIESTIESFGTVTLETELPLVVLKSEKDKQAQIMSVVPCVVPKSFNEFKLSLKFEFTLQDWKSRQYYQINGISVLPGGQIILADSDGRNLFILNCKGKLEKSISCPKAGSGPFGVAHIKDNEVAISTSIGIQIINIHSGTVLENINTDGKCQGIAYINGTLICCVQSKGIQCIQISNKAITTLVKGDDQNDRLGISVHGNKIYQTNRSHSVVNCYTLEGKHLWHFQNPSVLQYPTGITVDNNSNVYVATYRSNDVIVLSSDGKKFNQILTHKDGLRYPRALHYDENKLFVANINMPIYCYKVP